MANTSFFSDFQNNSVELAQNAFHSFINEYAWVALIIIICAFGFGWTIRRVLRPRCIEHVKKFNIHYRLKIALENMTRLILQLSALAFLFIGALLCQYFNYGTALLIVIAVSKLTMAWIFIRTLAQFIENDFVRQSIAIFAWGFAALSILGLLDTTTRTLDAAGMTFGETRISALTVIKALIALAILITLSMVLSRFFERRINKSTSLNPSVRVLMIKIVKISLIGLAIVIAVTSAGLDLSALAVFGGALGLGIGFGLQKVISNLFSGVLLLADRSIKPGDIIELKDGTFGWVGQLGSRYVSVVTRDYKEHLIPNEDFITQPVVNWSYSNRLIRIETKFGVHYDSDPHLVKKLAEQVALEPDRVVNDPKPVCHLVEFGDSSLNFVLRFWIEDPEQGVTNMRGAVMLKLWDAFKEHGIQIPYPHREVIMKQPVPEQKAPEKKDEATKAET